MIMPGNIFSSVPWNEESMYWISGLRPLIQYMAEHYFPEGKFKEAAPPSTDDLEPRKLLPKDLMGKVYIKYTCHFQVSKVKFLVGP